MKTVKFHIKEGGPPNPNSGSTNPGEGSHGHRHSLGIKYSQGSFYKDYHTESGDVRHYYNPESGKHTVQDIGGYRSSLNPQHVYSGYDQKAAHDYLRSYGVREPLDLQTHSLPF